MDGVLVPGGFGVRETQGKMLAMQTTQMKWKKQLVQLKIKTEMLKQEVCKKQLEVTEESEDGEEDNDDLYYGLQVNNFKQNRLRRQVKPRVYLVYPSPLLFKSSSP